MNSNVLTLIHRTVAVITVLLMTIAMPINLQVAAAEDSAWLDAAIAGSNELYPGQDAVIQISVQNNNTLDEIDPLVEQAGLSEYYGAAVGLTVELNEGNAPVSIKMKKVLAGTLPMGVAAQQIPFLLEVDDNAVSGKYRLSLVLTYKELSGVEISDAASGELKVSWADKTETVELEIYIEDNYETDFEISSIEAVLHPGKRSEIRVTFRNNGDRSAFDAVAKLSGAIAPLHLTDDTAFLGGIEPGGTAVGVFELKIDNDALGKRYSLDAEIKYSDEEGEKHISDTVKVPIDVTAGSSNFSDFITDNLAGGLTGAAIVALICLISFLISSWRRKKMERL